MVLISRTNVVPQACSWHYVGAQMLNPSQLSSLSSLSLANQNLSGKSLQALLASLRTYSQVSKPTPVSSQPKPATPFPPTARPTNR
eukprot:884802-Rhodomonas_salina.1